MNYMRYATSSYGLQQRFRVMSRKVRLEERLTCGVDESGRANSISDDETYQGRILRGNSQRRRSV